MRAVSLALVYAVWVAILAGGSRGDEEEPPVTDESPPVIDTTTGQVSGVREVSTKGSTFYAYRSIPFAKPPLGELRFKDPEVIERWEGVKDGSLDPPPCPQIPFLSLVTGSSLEVVGDEDCLYLNVFTPKPREEMPLLPVMVFIHGGAFMSGTALEYPPHVLLNHDVVLVVIQYRLGMLGFMSTEDDAAPGNLGLKDQTLALTWIQRNAHKFGGDFQRTTIFGESAGGGSVHFQILTHKSIGLFQRAILQSGTALCPWSLGKAHAQVAQYTGELFNCTGTSEQDSEAMVECLQQVPAADLVPIFLHFSEWLLSPLLVGPRVDGKYLPADPAFLMKEARHKRVDLIVGTTKNEGALVTFPMFANEAMRSSLLLNFRNIGPVSLNFNSEDISPLNQTIKIYDRYLGGIKLDADTADNVTQLFTDRFFTVCGDLTASLHAGNVARHRKLTFQYELTHRGQHSYGDAFDLNIGNGWVSHMDELFYMFTGGPLWKPLEREEDLQVRDTITTLWTNFAATGDPTPDDSLGFKWEPVTKDNLHFLALQPEPTMMEDYRVETREFWTSLPLKLNLDLFPERVSNLVYEEIKEEAEEGEEEQEEAATTGGETKEDTKEKEEEEATVEEERDEGEEGQTGEYEMKRDKQGKEKKQWKKDKKYEKSEGGKQGKEAKKKQDKADKKEKERKKDSKHERVEKEDHKYNKKDENKDEKHKKEESGKKNKKEKDKKSKEDKKGNKRDEL